MKNAVEAWCGDTEPIYPRSVDIVVLMVES